MKCPHGNQEHPEGTKFCPETGERMPNLVTDCPNKECSNYGRKDLHAHYKFCPDCGSKLVMEDVTSHNDFYTFNPRKAISPWRISSMGIL